MDRNPRRPAGSFSYRRCALILVAGFLPTSATILLSLFLLTRPLADPCNTPWRMKLHDHLHDIVLIINYNFEENTRDTAAFLRRIYSPFFDNIVLIAPRAVPEFGVKARSRHPFAQDWYGAYLGLEDIVEKFPTAEGYLWISDDVALNYWHLAQGNKSKVWVKRYDGQSFPFSPNAPCNHSDDWPAEPARRVSARRAFDSMDDTYRRQYLDSMAQIEGQFPKRVVDVMYLPSKHAFIMVKHLIPVFRKHRVWSEIALPMMLFSLEHPREYDSVFDDVEYRWEHRIHKDKEFDPRVYWTKDVTAMHPWKMSNKAWQVEYLATLGVEDPCLLTYLPDVEQS